MPGSKQINLNDKTLTTSENHGLDFFLLYDLKQNQELNFNFVGISSVPSSSS